MQLEATHDTVKNPATSNYVGESGRAREREGRKGEGENGGWGRERRERGA